MCSINDLNHFDVNKWRLTKFTPHTRSHIQIQELILSLYRFLIFIFKVNFSSSNQTNDLASFSKGFFSWFHENKNELEIHHNQRI